MGVGTIGPGVCLGGVDRRTSMARMQHTIPNTEAGPSGVAARRRPLPRATRSVIVVGAGVVGVATAYALARREMAVTLVDGAGEPGAGTSRANGAQLSYVFTDALASPTLLRRAPGLLLGLDPVFRWRVPLEPAYFGWLLRFLRNASSNGFRANTVDGLRLGLESRAALHALLERHSLQFSHRRAGKLHLYDSSSALSAAAAVVQLKRPLGASQEVLTHRETLDVEPALAARSTSFAGAVRSPQEEVGDPYRFCGAMVALLQQHYGVGIRFCTTIERVEVAGREAVAVTTGGERLCADMLVLCGGIGSNHLMRQMGCKDLLVPMKGYSFDAPRGVDAPRHSITDVARKWVMCDLDGSMRVAGLAELGTADLRVEKGRLEALVASVRTALPRAAHYDQASTGWAGLRSMTPSSLPIVRCLNSRFALNVGHGMLGWTFAMGSAERLANQIEGTVQ
jgi:D-amino-acid dehydrogenase